MTEKNDRTLNIDDILAHIRSEIERRKNAPYQGLDSAPDEDAFPDVAVRETALFRLVKRVQLRLMKLPFYHALYGVAIRFKRFIPRHK